jgi:hypothetical protein
MKRSGDSRWDASNTPGLLVPAGRDSDLDISPILGQLPAANLALGDEFEPGPVKMVGFEAPFECRGLGKQNLEDAPGNPHHALVFAHPDSELDDGAERVPPGIGRKAKKHGPPGIGSCSGLRQQSFAFFVFLLVATKKIRVPMPEKSSARLGSNPMMSGAIIVPPAIATPCCIPETIVWPHGSRSSA